jgi:hypothetical protein
MESRKSPHTGSTNFSSTHDPEIYSVENVSEKTNPSFLDMLTSLLTLNLFSLIPFFPLSLSSHVK